MLRREGHQDNVKRVYRLYREEGLSPRKSLTSSRWWLRARAQAAQDGCVGVLGLLVKARATNAAALPRT